MKITNIPEFEGIFLDDNTVEDRIEQVVMQETVTGAPTYQDPGWVITHVVDGVQQLVFISDTLVDHLVFRRTAHLR